MIGLFYQCKSLISLPDLSKWNTKNIYYLISTFEGCSSLLSLPDISNWNISNVKSLDSLFKGCKQLESLPDISKWNTSQIIELNDIFEDCSPLIFPNLSKWNLNNIENKDYIYKYILETSYKVSDIFDLSIISKSNSDIQSTSKDNKLPNFYSFSSFDKHEEKKSITKYNNFLFDESIFNENMTDNNDKYYEYYENFYN